MLLQRLSMLYIPDFFSQLLYGPCESAQSVAGHSETATRACSCGFVAKPWILYHLSLNEVLQPNDMMGFALLEKSGAVSWGHGTVPSDLVQAKVVQ